MAAMLWRNMIIKIGNDPEACFKKAPEPFRARKGIFS